MVPDSKEDESNSEVSLAGTGTGSYQFCEDLLPDWFQPMSSSMSMGDHFVDQYDCLCVSEKKDVPFDGSDLKQESTMVNPESPTENRPAKTENFPQIDKSDEDSPANQAVTVTPRYNRWVEALLKKATLHQHLQDTQYVPPLQTLVSSKGKSSRPVAQGYLSNSETLSEILENVPAHFDKTRWLRTCFHLVSGLLSFHNKGVYLNSMKPETIVVYVGEQTIFPTDIWFTELGQASFQYSGEFQGGSTTGTTTEATNESLYASDILSLSRLLDSIYHLTAIEELGQLVARCEEFPENIPTSLELYHLLLRAIRPQLYH